MHIKGFFSNTSCQTFINTGKEKKSKIHTLSGHPNIENGNIPEENQVSRTSSSGNQKYNKHYCRILIPQIIANCNVLFIFSNLKTIKFIKPCLREILSLETLNLAAAFSLASSSFLPDTQYLSSMS